MPSARAVLAALAALALAACTGAPDAAPDPEERSPSSAAGVERPAPPRSTADRPDARRDTVRVEGMAQPVELRLVRPPQGFPLPFTSYATDDFVVTETDRMGRPALRLVAAFGGRRNDDAFLEVAAYPAGASPEEAERRAREILGETAEPVPAAESSHPWAVGEWTARRKAPAGWELVHLVLGRHGTGTFHVLTRYPGDYADGFAPRTALFLEQWRWADGSALGSRSTP